MPASAPMTQRSLIVGGAGFIGVHLAARLLEEGDEVVVADLRAPQASSYAEHRWRALDGPTFHPLDVTDAATVAAVVERTRPDVVHYLASVGDAHRLRNDPILTERVIVGGFVNVAAAAAAARSGTVRRLVMASSEAVYAPPVPARITEDASTSWREARPYWYFGVAKAAAEGFTTAFAALEDLAIATVRFSGVYGPGMNYGMVVKEAVAAALDGDTTKAFPHGGSFPRAWTYVDDAVDSLVRASRYEQTTPAEVFHVASEERIRSTGEMLALLNEIVGGEFRVEAQLDAFEERDAANRAVLDLTKARSRLGFEPRFPLPDGLRRYVDDVRAYREAAAGVK